MKVLKARKATLLFGATSSNNIEIYALPYLGGCQNLKILREMKSKTYVLSTQIICVFWSRATQDFRIAVEVRKGYR